MKGNSYVSSCACSLISPKFPLTVYKTVNTKQTKKQFFSSPFLCGNLNDAADHCVVPCVERVGGGDAAALHPAGAALRKRETRCIFLMFMPYRLFFSQFWKMLRITKSHLHWKGSFVFSLK